MCGASRLSVAGACGWPVRILEDEEVETRSQYHKSLRAAFLTGGPVLRG